MSIESAELSPDSQAIVTLESSVANTVVAELKSVRTSLASRYQHECSRSRALTSEIVGERRSEERVLLSSNEAVSHGMRDQLQEDLTIIEKLIDTPYFARVELEEELPSGQTQKIEYKIGHFANTDCRIIDWKKAPIARLYYEYKEGDDYSETIQGRERCGTISLRRQLVIKKGELTQIKGKDISLRRKADGGWFDESSSQRSRMDRSRYDSVRTDGRAEGRTEGAVPDVISLITPEQFARITEGAEGPVFLEGRAGSGKTTVALYRLSWAISNSSLNPKRCAIIAKSPILRRYIERSLTQLAVPITHVIGPEQLLLPTVKKLYGSVQFQIAPVASTSHARVKRSMALLRVLDAVIMMQPDRAFKVSLQEIRGDIFGALRSPEKILAHDATRLLSKALIEEVAAKMRQDIIEGKLDGDDIALLAYVFIRKTGNVYLHEDPMLSAAVLGTHVAPSLGTFDHIVIDEAQDLSPLQLAALMLAVKKREQLTVVGDSGQSILGTTETFGEAGKGILEIFGGHKAHAVSLLVAHRSTRQINRLCDAVRGDVATSTTLGEGREGRVPLWFKKHSEQAALEAAIGWLKKAQELYPDRIACVVCPNPKVAKELESMLRPSFGASVRLGDEDSFSFDEGILVTDVASVKGLEFFSVLAWGVTAQYYGDEEIDRKRLYVALTRAEENLAMVSFGPATRWLAECVMMDKTLVRISQ